MADVDEFIDYIKSLKRGFDKNLYASKIAELAYAAESIGIGIKDFHTLVKIWLNLSIPIAKWTSLGCCLVPQDIIEERTLDYALCWILGNKNNSMTTTKVAFVLDWLTAAMDANCVDMEILDLGYDIFFEILSNELLAIHAIKLVYTLSKPSDVTRKRVLEILQYIKLRDAKRNCVRQLQVILGLFKSYKPELVPEDVPAMSVHTSFKKINDDLIRRFQISRDRSNNMKPQDKHILSWMNPLNSKRNKNADPLVPNVEILTIGSNQYTNGKTEKSYLDFSNPISLLQHSLYYNMSRPARMRALLCNEAAITCLILTTPTEYSFFTRDLHQLLNNCFLEISPYSYVEKQDLLLRLALLQHNLMQGIPVITRFLAQFLPLWNERDFFDEIMQLVEWISVDNPNQVSYIIEPLTRIYYRSPGIQQCSILRSLTYTYCNLAYTSTRAQYNIINVNIPQENFTTVLQKLAMDISQMCDKQLQVNPDDIRVLYTSVRSTECRAAAELRCGVTLNALPGKLTLALPIIGTSVYLIDKMAALMILYKKLFKKVYKQNIDNNKENAETLIHYTEDMINCLYKEQALSERNKGLIFKNLPPELLIKLSEKIQDIDSIFSIRNGLAFMPYAPLWLESYDYRDLDKKKLFSLVIEDTFKSLNVFLKTVVPELRT